MTTGMLTESRPLILRSQAEMARALRSLPAMWRDVAFADEAHRRAVHDGDQDEALFWSEVKLLLLACDEAGVSATTGEAAERPLAGHRGLRWMLHA